MHFSTSASCVAWKDTHHNDTYLYFTTTTQIPKWERQLFVVNVYLASQVIISFQCAQISFKWVHVQLI